MPSIPYVLYWYVLAIVMLACQGVSLSHVMRLTNVIGIQHSGGFSIPIGIILFVIISLK